MSAPAIVDVWAGLVPSSWRVEPLGAHAWIRARLGWKGLTADEYVDEGIPMLSTPEIKGQRIAYENANRITQQRYDESPEIKLANGDVLLTKDGSTIGIVNVVRDLSEPATVNGSIAVISTTNTLDPQFLHWVLASPPSQQVMSGLKDGMGVPHLFQRDIRRMRLPIPTVLEQRAIADFLDRETAQIDEFIAENERFIELLTERRAAVIVHAVTKGLDPDVPLRDSGVEWLGEVPEGWEVMPLRYAIQRVEQGDSPQADARLAEGADEIGVLKSGCVNGGMFRAEEHKALPPGYQVDRKSLVHEGDLLISRASGSIDLLGSAARVTVSRYRLMLSDKTYRLVPSSRTVASFLTWLLNSSAYRTQVRASVSGAEGLANNLPLSTLRSFVLPFPPLPQQRAIADYLDERTARIDEAIATARGGIALAKERRSALISAAVTGKIDVGGGS